MVQAIEINDLWKTYSAGWCKTQRQALRGVSLSVAEGETFGFVGANGAGKSTLMKILTGALVPTSGSALLWGKASSDCRARIGLGFVPENPSMQEHLTPFEILLMGVRMHRVCVSNEASHCMHWLDRFELGRVARSRVRGFSKGMMQRTALAHALAIRPRLLILDEPLSGLDPVGRRDVVDILSEYRRSGGTLFFSSHVLYDVERLADRIGLIHQGELRATISSSNLVSADDLVLVRTQGDTPLAGGGLDTSGRWFAEVPRKDLWQLMDEARLAGHQIIEIKPALSLESAFLRIVSRTIDS